MIQWSNGPMDRTLTQCSIAISRLDGIGMGYIMSTGIGFFFFLSGLWIVHYIGFEGGTHSQ